MTCGRALLEKNRALSVDQCCRPCNLQCISSICWAYFSDECFRQDSGSYGGSDSNRPPVTMTFLFWRKFVFGSKFEEALDLPLSPATALVIASCHIKSFFVAHHNPSEKWFIVASHKRRRHFKMILRVFLCLSGKESTYQAKQWFFWLRSAHEAPT